MQARSVVGAGVDGGSTNGIGVYGVSTNSYAIYANGDAGQPHRAVLFRERAGAGATEWPQ